MKTWTRVAVYVGVFVLVLALIVWFIFWWMMGGRGRFIYDASTSTDAADYDAYVAEVVDADKYMPKLSSIGEYESICITRRHEDGLIDTIDTVAVIIRYDQANFDAEVARIQQTYTFMKAEHAESQIGCSPTATVRSYDISVVAGGRPRSMFLIGINEEEQSIAYMAHYDFELDSISNLRKFVRRYYILPRR